LRLGGGAGAVEGDVAETIDDARRTRTRRWTPTLLRLAALAAVGLALGWYVLITPSNLLTGLFRGAPSAASARVTIGPYPLPEDFTRLAADGVGTLVSLLDPRILYERVLLERERKTAATFGMKVLSYPIASILGHRLDPNPEQRIAAAADAVAAVDGKVYVHCYLGVHRAQAVAEAVIARGARAERWVARATEREERARRRERAQRLFHEGKIEAADAELARIDDPDVDALVLYGWVRLRLNDLTGAAEHFRAALAAHPDVADAEVGLGFVALRTNDLAEAEPHFTRALALTPNHADALVGLGLVRFRQGRHAEAAERLRAALAIDPNRPEARSTLAKLDVRD
jgi:Flp pilus assembly protein TadD